MPSPNENEAGDFRRRVKKNKSARAQKVSKAQKQQIIVAALLSVLAVFLVLIFLVVLSNRTARLTFLVISTHSNEAITTDVSEGSVSPNHFAAIHNNQRNLSKVFKELSTSNSQLTSTATDQEGNEHGVCQIGSIGELNVDASSSLVVYCAADLQIQTESGQQTLMINSQESAPTSFREFLTSLQKQSKEETILVMLEPIRQAGDSVHGISEFINTILKQPEYEKFRVLLACDDGEYCWEYVPDTALKDGSQGSEADGTYIAQWEQMNGTVFGHFISKGFAFDREPRIDSIKDLHEFVADKVQEWVSDKYGCPQTVKLLPEFEVNGMPPLATMSIQEGEFLGRLKRPDTQLTVPNQEDEGGKPDKPITQDDPNERWRGLISKFEVVWHDPLTRRGVSVELLKAHKRMCYAEAHLQHGNRNEFNIARDSVNDVLDQIIALNQKGEFSVKDVDDPQIFEWLNLPPGAINNPLDDGQEGPDSTGTATATNDTGKLIQALLDPSMDVRESFELPSSQQARINCQLSTLDSINNQTTNKKAGGNETKANTKVLHVAARLITLRDQVFQVSFGRIRSNGRPTEYQQIHPLILQRYAGSSQESNEVGLQELLIKLIAAESWINLGEPGLDKANEIIAKAEQSLVQFHEQLRKAQQKEIDLNSTALVLNLGVPLLSINGAEYQTNNTDRALTQVDAALNETESDEWLNKEWYSSVRYSHPASRRYLPFGSDERNVALQRILLKIEDNVQRYSTTYQPSPIQNGPDKLAAWNAKYPNLSTSSTKLVDKIGSSIIGFYLDQRLNAGMAQIAPRSKELNLTRQRPTLDLAEILIDDQSNEISFDFTSPDKKWRVMVDSNFLSSVRSPNNWTTITGNDLKVNRKTLAGKTSVLMVAVLAENDIVHASREIPIKRKLFSDWTLSLVGSDSTLPIEPLLQEVNSGDYRLTIGANLESNLLFGIQQEAGNAKYASVEFFPDADLPVSVWHKVVELKKGTSGKMEARLPLPAESFQKNEAGTILIGRRMKFRIFGRMAENSTHESDVMELFVQPEFTGPQAYIAPSNLTFAAKGNTMELMIERQGGNESEVEFEVHFPDHLEQKLLSEQSQNTWAKLSSSKETKTFAFDLPVTLDEYLSPLDGNAKEISMSLNAFQNCWFYDWRRGASPRQVPHPRLTMKLFADAECKKPLKPVGFRGNSRVPVYGIESPQNEPQEIFVRWHLRLPPNGIGDRPGSLCVYASRTSDPTMGFGLPELLYKIPIEDCSPFWQEIKLSPQDNGRWGFSCHPGKLAPPPVFALNETFGGQAQPEGKFQISAELPDHPNHTVEFLLDRSKPKVKDISSQKEIRWGQPIEIRLRVEDKQSGIQEVKFGISESSLRSAAVNGGVATFRLRKGEEGYPKLGKSITIYYRTLNQAGLSKEGAVKRTVFGDEKKIMPPKLAMPDKKAQTAELVLAPGKKGEYHIEIMGGDISKSLTITKRTTVTLPAPGDYLVAYKFGEIGTESTVTIKLKASGQLPVILD